MSLLLDAQGGIEEGLDAAAQVHEPPAPRSARRVSLLLRKKGMWHVPPP